MATPFQQPDIDPVLLHLWGPLQIRWYSLLYVGGFLVGKALLNRLAREDRFQFNQDQVERLVLWSLLGAVLGARIFYCVVYDPQSLLADPFYLFQVYRGGLSFHGGFLGVAIASLLFARRERLPWWNLVDAMCFVAPFGLAMGRIGNFINGELFGRVTDMPWGVVFREGGPQPRHPSQLYEFFLEGVVLFLVLLWIKRHVRRDGVISFGFAYGYTVVRFIVEYFREPDAHLGFLFLGLSMGQLLSVTQLLVVVGINIAYLRQTPTPPYPNVGKKKLKPKKTV